MIHRSPYYKQIAFIYWAVFALLLILFLISLFVVMCFGAVGAVSVNDKETFKTIIVILALLGIPAGFTFHQKRIAHLPQELPLDKKLKYYRNSFFIKIVTLEALAIIALTGYMVTSDVVFLLIFGLLFVAFVLNIPAKSRVMRELEPHQEEENPY